MHPAIETCLLRPPIAQPAQTVGEWLTCWHALVAERRTPVELAVLGGFQADRLAWAFASGYQAALRAMAPAPGLREVFSFCMTEPSGNRPRDIRTELSRASDRHYVINGEKCWSSMGPVSTSLLIVAAAENQADGRRALRVARVPAATAGIVIEPMPETRFIPEIPHAVLKLRNVAVEADALLPGDGWEDYGKRFRTLEDVHVMAAALSYLLREARARAWPREFMQRCAACLALFCDLAQDQTATPAAHVALAGAIDWAQQLFVQAGAAFPAPESDPVAARWQRDTRLLSVASEARALRAARAWERLASG